MAKYTSGDKIVFGRCKANKEANKEIGGITIGRIYTLREEDGVVCFYDDDKDKRSGPLELYTVFKVTKIVK